MHDDVLLCCCCAAAVLLSVRKHDHTRAVNTSMVLRLLPDGQFAAAAAEQLPGK